MENQNVKRYTLEEELVLSYNERGWVLLRNGEEPIGSDLHQENLKVPYKEHKSLLDYIKEIISKGLEDTVH
ncbi:MAG: hypothetical protein U9P07_01870 [Pseudomonadota bacterium]|nr:hypothetical protein [Pseudomonadota bacterium]